MPPRVEIELTEAGRELLPIAEALSRWGLRHAWSTPQTGELIDVEALLRMFPALLSEPLRLPNALVQLVVHDGDRNPRVLLRIKDGQAGVTSPDQPTARPSVSISGDPYAWRDALAPRANLERLEFDGDEQLARRLLGALRQP
jgi:hypothetical protein